MDCIVDVVGTTGAAGVIGAAGADDAVGSVGAAGVDDVVGSVRVGAGTWIGVVDTVGVCAGAGA